MSDSEYAPKPKPCTDCGCTIWNTLDGKVYCNKCGTPFTEPKEEKRLTDKIYDDLDNRLAWWCKEADVTNNDLVGVLGRLSFNIQFNLAHPDFEETEDDSEEEDDEGWKQ